MFIKPLMGQSTKFVLKRSFEQPSLTAKILLLEQFESNFEI